MSRPPARGGAPARRYAPPVEPNRPAPFVLPRPPEWRLGSNTPWLAPGVTVPAHLTTNGVAATLEAGGFTASTQSRPPVAEWPGVPELEAAATAAVLICLFDDDDGECRVLFERRAPDLRRHRDEVVFPGGFVEAGESAIEAALRETREELGIPAGDVTVVGRLTPLRTYSGQIVIEPVVGALRSRPVLSVEPAEVAYAFDVALAALLADGAFHEELWRREGNPDAFAIYVFEVDGETIWGATARILAELCSVLTGVARR